LQETEIIIPIKGGTTSSQIEFVPFIDGQPRTAGKLLSFNPEKPTPAFDLDPYGSLFTWRYNDSNTSPTYEIAMINGNEKQTFVQSNTIPSLPGISYDKKNARVYFVSDDTYLLIFPSIKIRYFDLSDMQLKSLETNDNFFEAVKEFIAGGISERKVITLDTRNNETFIYIGINEKSADGNSIILKYKVDNDKASETSVKLRNIRIKDLRVIDDYVYAITEDTIGSGSAITAIKTDKKIDDFIDNPLGSLQSTANKPYYFQRIVGWDTGFIYVLEYWEDGNGRRISKISRDLKRIEDTKLAVPDTLYWK
jgi:hypothetical protein